MHAHQVSLETQLELVEASKETNISIDDLYSKVKAYDQLLLTQRYTQGQQLKLLEEKVPNICDKGLAEMDEHICW